MKYAATISQILLITLILSLGFGQLLRFEYFGVVFYLHDALVLALLGLNLQGQALKVLKVKSLPTWFKLIVIGLAIGWVRAVTMFPVTSLLTPMFYTLRILAYLTLYLVLKNRSFRIPRSYFITAGAVTLITALTQYFLLPDMRGFQYLGWDDHLNRATLPHFDPTFTAVMLGLFIFSLLQPFIIHYSLFIIPVVFGILLTYSRSVWLSLILTFTFFVKKQKILLFLIPILLFSILLLPTKPGEGTNLLRTFSIGSRLIYDLNLAKEAGFNLITGMGYNTYAISSVSEKGYDNHVSGANNSYLVILSTMGIVGLAGWILLLRHLYRSLSIRHVVIFVIIASLFNNVLLYPFALLWLLLISFEL